MAESFFRFNFDNVSVRPTGYKDPHVRIDWNSKQGKCSAGASRSIIAQAKRSAVGTDHPLFLEILGISGSRNVGLRPIVTKNESCVDVAWTKDLKLCRLDLTKLLALQPIPLLKRTKAIIDMKVGTLEGLGEVLILEWNEARVQPIAKRKSSGQGASAPQSGQQPGQQPGPMADTAAADDTGSEPESGEPEGSTE